MTYEILVTIDTDDPGYLKPDANRMHVDLQDFAQRELDANPLWPRGSVTVSVRPRAVETGPAEGLRWTAAESVEGPSAGGRSVLWHLTRGATALCWEGWKAIAGRPKTDGTCPECEGIVLSGALPPSAPGDP